MGIEPVNTKSDPNLTETQPDDELELVQRLLSLRREPGPELRRTVQAIPQPQPGPSRLQSLKVLKTFRVWQRPAFNWGIASLLVAVLLFVSPIAKATLVEMFVGRIHLIIAEVFPQSQAPAVDKSRIVSLAEAQASIPFDLALPGYLPAGLQAASPQFSVIELASPIVKILWRDTDGGFVQLTIHAPAGSDPTRLQTLIGPHSSQTILINDQQAVLINGAWAEPGQTWDHHNQLKTLIWQVDHIQYKLLAFSDLVTSAELIAMAESIRP
jgi:hypothetical protein